MAEGLVSPVSLASIMQSLTVTSPSRRRRSSVFLPKRRPEYVPESISDPLYVRILDTTLRDGEQAPGAAMTCSQKLVVARQLARMGVDVIEAGFPASSPENLRTVRAIAEEIGNTAAGEDGYVPVICALGRCRRRDIDAVWEAVRHAARPRIHTFIATSDIHMQHKLRMTRKEVVTVAREMVAYSRDLGCNDIEFGMEDAGRSDREFLYQILEELIEAGVTTVNIPDTVGYTLPSEYGSLIADIRANTRGIEKIILSTHCHNDLGVATANTLAGIQAGARQMELTINGIGERAGNASLEEVAMAVKCLKGQMGGLYTGINSKHIFMASKMVEEYSGLHLQQHKPIVGANAFAHNSNILLDRKLKFKGEYKTISAEDVGLARPNDSGFVLRQLSRVDIDQFVSSGRWRTNMTWFLSDLQVTRAVSGLSRATVKLVAPDGEEKVAFSVGKGPVGAAFKAVDNIIQVPVTLVRYSMNPITQGTDAIASVSVEICRSNGKSKPEPVQQTFRGSGEDKDVVVSSVRAYLDAFNKMLGSNAFDCASNGACKYYKEGKFSKYHKKVK